MNFFRGRNIERVFLLLIGAVLAFLFFRLFAVLKKDFDEVPQRISDGTMVNLNTGKLDERIRLLLQKGFYFEDPKDIELAQRTVAQGMSNRNDAMDNIGELNKRQFNLTTEQAYALGGESYRKRAELARTLIGFTGDDSLRFNQEIKYPPALSSSVDIAMGKHSINGTVKDANDQPVAAVLVRLQMILPDSMYNIELTDVVKTVT